MNHVPSGLDVGMEASVWLVNGVVNTARSTPGHISVRRCLKSFTSCRSLVDLMLNCPRFCHQLMADECLAVCFTTLLRKASFQTLQTKITIYYNHYRDLSVSISWFVTGLLGWVSAPPTQSHFLQCVRALWPSVGTSCFSTAFSVFCSFNSCCLHEN